MNTKYKILLIIATSAVIYILFHGGITNTCMTFIDDGQSCFMFWLFDTSIQISYHDWDTGDGIGAWSGTGEIYQPTLYDNLKDNSGFIFWHIILPTFAILLMYQKDRLKK